MRLKAKVDTNHRQIVARLRAHGASVANTHTVGSGFPDCAVGYRGKTYLVEIKDGDKPPSARKLTPDEQRWHDEWRGHVEIICDEVGVDLFMLKLRENGL